MSKSHETAITLLIKWRHRASRSLTAHYDVARNYSHLNYWVGIPAVVLSTIVAATLFAGLERNVTLEWRLMLAIISGLSAGLTGFQTLFRFSELSEKHRLTGARYGAVCREIEFIITTLRKGDQDDFPNIDALKRSLDSLAEDAPSIPKRFLNMAEEKYPKSTILKQQPENNNSTTHEKD
jgi:hypothetical protein